MEVRPDIKAMFFKLNGEHFNGEIPDILVVWNTRMTTTAGYCRYKRSGLAGSFNRREQVLAPYKIDLSDKLFKHLGYDLEKIERTLIHEMVHAYLLHKFNEKGHTARFQRMMTNITGEYKNHRCHSYNTAGIEKRRAKDIKWACDRCEKVGFKARAPMKGRAYYCRCGGRVEFSDLRKVKSKVSIF